MAAIDYLKILRPVDGLMAAFAVLIGYIVASGTLTAANPLLYAMVSVFLFSGAGIALNDYCDFEMDKVNAPHRPLPSGKISRKTALHYSAILFAIAIALAFLINIQCLALALLNTVLEILYAFKFKRIALLGNFTDSWFPASSFLYGAFAVQALGAVPLLALLAFLANTGREIFGDIEDIEGDRKQKAKTLPIILGERNARFLACVFVLAAVALSPVPWLLGLLSLNYIFVVALADIVFLASLFSNPSKNQALTKWAMVLAMLAFAAGVF
ncbi:MAG: UbiA family prenyltransferase [Candidatus Diapherotrites archaeon]|nr:UbiA family prenyltransferase [Candidatus Diapherotrites archaeon]